MRVQDYIGVRNMPLAGEVAEEPALVVILERSEESLRVSLHALKSKRDSSLRSE